MKSDFLGIIFDIIVLIVLVVLIVYIIMVFIGVAMGNELKYIGYLNSIADAINNKYNESIFISNYDYNYVFVLTNNSGWYLQLYHCLPPNFVLGLLSVKVVYWNVSTIDNGNTIIFAPALVYCKLIKQKSLNVNEINITIQGLNDNAGLLAYTNNNKSLGLFEILASIATNLANNVYLPSQMFVAIVNDTSITCDNSGCTFTSPTGENGNIYCAPNPNVNPSNLSYNPSECVELSGFPQNPQISISNLEGELIDAVSFGSLFTKTFQTNFPILYFAGSLPPTAMYIDVNRNGDTANINIYIGETVS
jgi:hypothetical protein